MRAKLFQRNELHAVTLAVIKSVFHKSSSLVCFFLKKTPVHELGWQRAMAPVIRVSLVFRFLIRLGSYVTSPPFLRELSATGA